METSQELHETSAVGSLTGVPTAQQTASTSGLTLDGLTASETDPDYTVNYKIVGVNASNREIMGYGFADCQEIVASQNLTCEIKIIAKYFYKKY